MRRLIKKFYLAMKAPEGCATDETTPESSRIRALAYLDQADPVLCAIRWDE
jgi:hypothetical protein